MPLTVFDVKGIPATRRERVETAVIAGARHLREPYEGWITADPFRGGVKLWITGPNGLQREVAFAIEEETCCDHGTCTGDFRGVGRAPALFPDVGSSAASR
jgi:hypothetical protein